jgi:Tol biopolymer transport system component
MNRMFVIFIAVVLAAGMQTTRAQQNTADAEKLLARAQHKATFDGDLKGAIEDLKKALAAAGGNRALAAQALLSMAECHQKLGEAEAQAIYERLVRDYADQKDTAVVARSRLSSPKSVARVKGDWSVWAGRDADGFGTISRDGRYLTYTDWHNGGNLALRDLTTGTNHRLTTDGSTQFSVISRDGKQVVYQWWDSKSQPNARRHELRVARLHATSISESRPLFQNDDVKDVAPYDWSPDGKWIAVAISRKDLTGQIGLIGAQDGSLRVLKSLDWKQPTKIFFSPDGRYIAYDLMVTDSSEERHVFVMAVDGSREADVVAHPSQNAIMGWSPDGQHVLFSSNRSGSFGLWAVPVADGKPVGAPTLVKADVSSSWSLGLTAAGTMYVWKYASPIFVQTSAIDLAAGRLASAPTFQRFITSRGRPDWSADGKYLAYQSCNPLGGGPCTLLIRSMETGQLRELKLKLGYFGFFQWSPDGRELLTAGRDMKGRNAGLYRIDAQTGDATLVVLQRPGNSPPQWGADGKHLYYRRGSAVIERDLATGAEREAGQIPNAGVGPMVLSPDGRDIAYEADESSGGKGLFVKPLAGGVPRPVFHVTAPERLFRAQWTADGRALAVTKQLDETGRWELWLVDVNGEKPRKLDINVENWMMEDGFRFDRAGKQVAFVAAAGQPGLEIRALENFLPAAAATQGAKK